MMLSTFSCAEEQGAIDILSWNVWFDEATADSRYPQILDAISEINPDMVLLQEVTQAFIEHYYHSSLSATYYLMTSRQTKYNYGQAFLSRRRLFSTHNEPLASAFGRSVFFGVLEINNNQAVLVVNVHLESGRFESSVRAKQVEVINNQYLPVYLDKLNSDTKSPDIVGIVWGGDFNLKGKKGHQLLSEYWQDTALHFKNSLPTYDIKNNVLASEHSGWFSNSSRLDRFYLKQGSKGKVLEYKLYNQSLFGILSDHYPIKIILGLDQ